jgi:hypothetical protein
MTRAILTAFKGEKLMSTRRFLNALSVLVGGALICSSAGQVQAGGCWSAGCGTEEKPPIVYKTFKKRTQVEQGVYEIVRQPSLYGWTVPAYGADAKGAGYTGYAVEGGSRRVLLKPYKNIAIYHRARHVHSTERVAIQPEPYGGEWSWWDHIFD